MKRVRAFSACLLVMIGSARAGDGGSSPQLHCGAYCLYLGLRALDLPPNTYEDVEVKLGQPTPMGYSMEQLAEAAKAFGAQTLGVETSLENLRLRSGRFACIALLKEGHFVNIYDIDDHRVFIVDPPETKQIDLDGFRAIWTGKALLISARALTDESSLRGHDGWPRVAATILGLLVMAGWACRVLLTRRRAIALCIVVLSMTHIAGCQATPKPTIPAILVQPSHINLGEVPLGGDRAIPVAVQIRNPGTAALLISSVKATCVCTFVHAPVNELEAGRECTMRIVVRPGIQPGKRESVVVIQSNDPVAPLGWWSAEDQGKWS